MANDKPNSDETDLVDASQLPDDDVTDARENPAAEETDQDSHEDPFALQMDSGKPGQATIASLRERLAGFIVDVGILWLLFWGILYIFHKVTTHVWIGPVPTAGTVALFFHGIFLLVAFLYFFLFEAAFFATIGKFCCWMYVRRKDGRHAGALAIFIRNFFRVIELASSWVLAWAPMELTKRHQRLGDIAAGTIVIKKHSADGHYYPMDAERLASAFGRSIALIIDGSIVAMWLVGYVLLINYQAIYLSQWLVIAFPVLCVLFWTLVQVILETTPGLWVLGYTITHEDGGRLTFAGALLRVIASPIDLVLGLPSMLLSLRKQKVCDMFAATVVSRQRRRWKGAIGSLIVVAICVGLAALGLFVNPVNNVFKAGTDFKLSFMPLVEGLPDWESANLAQPPVLTLRNFRFGVNDPNTRRTPPVYEPGETVYLLFEIYGYARKDRMVWIQEDLMVQYPDGSIGLKQENVVDYHQIVKPGAGPIELTNNIALPPNAAPGVYVVSVTLRDALADNFIARDTQSFTVKAPPSMTSPLEAAPAPVLPSSPLPAEQYGAPQSPAADAGTVQPQSMPPPTVPPSPLPVVPAEPAIAPIPTTPMPPSPAPVAPAGGFTVLPGPAIAPKEEAVPPPIPVVKALPSDQYGAAPTPAIPSDPYAKPGAVPAVVPVIPAPTGAAPTPVPTPPTITEKTLPPERSVAAVPTDPYAKSPVDPYAKPAVKVTPPPAPAPSPAKPAPKAAAPTKTETQKAAEAELKKSAPAAEVPSAEEVKKQQKKKKAASDSGSSGGYMP